MILHFLRCIKKVIKSFDKKQSMILSPSGHADLSKGEHRNILAIMLLSWGERLFQGPDLSHYQDENFNQHFYRK